MTEKNLVKTTTKENNANISTNLSTGECERIFYMIDNAESEPRIGIAVIKSFVKKAGQGAGVYRMLNANGDVLYVGKAKNLQNRITNYTTPDKLSPRIQKMVMQTAKMEVTNTNTEAEALLLEANLIKSLKPRYNILLRDDKSFPYIEITSENNKSGVKFSRLTKHRGKKNKQSTYFGPFASAGDVNKAISEIQKAFLLRNCTDNFFKSRSRPCMEYQIKRCSAPCVDKISYEDYHELTNQAKDFLEGKNSDIQKSLIKIMEESSSQMEYEKAAIYRNRIQALRNIQSSQSINHSSINNADVVAIASQDGQYCINIFFIRGGNTLGSKSYFPTQTDGYLENEILQAFITDFYQKNPAPSLIITSHDLFSKATIEEALSSISDYKISINYPLRGKKLALIDMVADNALKALIRKNAQDSSIKNNLKQVAKLFDIEGEIKRIETYDNSHLFGKQAFGAMIVAGEEGFIKNAYRKFKVDSGAKITGGDDYFMLRQVLTRRFSKLDKNNKPDAILIDGGKGQLSVAIEVFKELGIKDIKFACIAKGVDRNAGNEDFLFPDGRVFKLEKNSSMLFYLQQLRDEAHRFAIGSHRVKRNKDIIKSELDEVPNIGAKRKKALLNHFGSVRAIKQATLKELLEVEGINKNTAKTILTFLS